MDGRATVVCMLTLVSVVAHAAAAAVNTARERQEKDLERVVRDASRAGAHVCVCDGGMQFRLPKLMLPMFEVGRYACAAAI
jgi:predicted peroxiredoxin